MEQASTVDKAIDVLLHIRGQSQPCGVSELSRAMSLPKSSAHRLLSVLTRRGLVERDEQGRYRLGIGLLSLGLGALDQDPVVVAAHPVLEAEARAIGETCFLVAARRGRLSVLDRVEGTGLLRASPRIGSDVPVHATAAGKLYLALAPELLDGAKDGWERYTDRTLSEAAFRTQLAEIVEAGYAVNMDEWIEGLSVFSAPVYSDGKLSAVLAIAIPSGRVLELDRATLIARVTDAAVRIGARVDGRSM